jgi:pimeloyl-ACP methyl ester carboxylesterase
MHFVEQGQGPLVLLCHGWPETWHTWRHQLPALAAAGFRAIAPDQRGYGETDSPESVEAYDIFNLVGDLVGLVQALSEEQAFVVGHDWGSIVAANAALLRPDMFKALGMLSIPYIPRMKVSPKALYQLLTAERNFYQDYFQTPGRAEQELDHDPKRSLSGIIYEGCAEAEPAARGSFVFFDKNTRLVDNLVIPEKLPTWLAQTVFDEMVNAFIRSGFRGGLNWYRNMHRNWMMTSFLDGAKVQQPGIYIGGDQDEALTMVAEQVEALHQNVPNLRGKHILQGVGHWTQQERPEEFNALLIPFLLQCGREV